MSRLWRLLAIAALAAAVWPELPRYAAEWRLRAANQQLERALDGVQQAARQGQAGDVAQIRQDAAQGLRLAGQAAAALPGDARVTLARAVGLLLSGRGGEAASLLDAAVAASERPEFTLNLGRARTTQGDSAGADAAYLRTAWASAQATATLPRALRETLQRQVAELEARLRAGNLPAPPPLRPAPASNPTQLPAPVP
ncbi:hypothetical protein [Tahibacter harae]|uniref:MxaK protein n=1 Tax=Tahibacter harae TaxID=2963937 RepID=A0ABT1QU58_9GAMM|nr:hypothetical protein [Tahibacter harae]MCQ4165830.1 hypothetical protein [Tahibacter harae]